MLCYFYLGVALKAFSVACDQTVTMLGNFVASFCLGGAGYNRDFYISDQFKICAVVKACTITIALVIGFEKLACACLIERNHIVDANSFRVSS